MLTSFFGKKKIKGVPYPPAFALEGCITSPSLCPLPFTDIMYSIRFCFAHQDCSYGEGNYKLAINCCPFVSNYFSKKKTMLNERYKLLDPDPSLVLIYQSHLRCNTGSIGRPPGQCATLLLWNRCDLGHNPPRVVALVGRRHLDCDFGGIVIAALLLHALCLLLQRGHR